MNNENNKNMDGLATLLKTMVAPIAWDRGIKDKVVSGIEGAKDRKLTDEEVDVAKAAWCHGFSVDPKEVLDAALPTGERGSTDD